MYTVLYNPPNTSLVCTVICYNLHNTSLSYVTLYVLIMVCWAWLKSQLEGLALESKHRMRSPGCFDGKSQTRVLVFSQAQHSMIKSYYSMSLHCNTTIIVCRLLAIIEWQSRYQLQRLLLGKTGCCLEVVAYKYTSLESFSFILWYDIMVAKEQQWLLGNNSKMHCC